MLVCDMIFIFMQKQAFAPFASEIATIPRR